VKDFFQRCIICAGIFIPASVHAYPPGFDTFVYQGIATLNPFTGQTDNSQIMLESNCHIDGFPDLGRYVTCTPDGTLIVAEGIQMTNEVGSENFEGRIVGLFALRSKEHILVKLDRPASTSRLNCPSTDNLIMPVSDGDADDMRVQTAVNALSFKHTVRFDIQGCELGHPRIIDFEILDCDSKECQETLKLSLPVQYQFISK